MDEKIKKLDAELARYREQIKNTRPGPAQEAVKARAMRVLKQRKMWVIVFLSSFCYHRSFCSVTAFTFNCDFLFPISFWF